MTLPAPPHHRALQCAALFFAPFLHEDVAVVMAATFIHELGLHPAVAFGSLYAGVVASDLLIYALGRGARRWLSLRRFVSDEKLRRAQRRLQKNRVLAIALCRLVPGLLFSTFVACGWFGIPFLSFLGPALATSAIYTGILLLLVLKFGGAIVSKVGNWGWFLAIGLLLVFGLGLLARRALRGLIERDEPDPEAGTAAGASLIAGMPPVPPSARRVAPSEKIPPILYYIPLGLRWIWLGLRHGSLTLPALADPCIEAGGLWGESKSGCLGQISGDQSRWVAGFVACERRAGEEAQAYLRRTELALAAAGLGFPLVAKPDVGWQGFGVQLLADRDGLARYLLSYPDDATVILQRHVPYDGEAGILYVRMPGEESGRVVSLTLRYFPHVIGDGASTVRELIEREPRMRLKSRFYLGADRKHRGVAPGRMDAVPAAGEMVRLSFIGSIRVGGLYRDARAYITPALSARFDAIAGSMPEFYFGRFDVRFATLERLQAGEDFAIIEVNGAGAEAIHMWDPEMSLGAAYRELIDYQTLLFEIGRRNRARGYRPMTLREFFAFTDKQNRLIRRYPPSI